MGKKDGLDVIWFGTFTLVPNLRECLAKTSTDTSLSYTDFPSILLTTAVLQVFVHFIFLRLISLMPLVSII